MPLSTCFFFLLKLVRSVSHRFFRFSSLLFRWCRFAGETVETVENRPHPVKLITGAAAVQRVEPQDGALEGGPRRVEERAGGGGGVPERARQEAAGEGDK